MEADQPLELERANLFTSWQSSSRKIASPQDYQLCRQIMRAASRNYSFASAFFPSGILPHVEALYALMRVGDDRVDVSSAGFSSALEAIDDWEKLYWDAFDRGDSPHPVMRAYLNTAIERGIPKETMAPYFRAMREDLTITRFPTFEHLLHYMEGSAVPVGRAMLHILGVKKPYTLEEALPGADSLSIAMQLSNFWRDIGSDWNINRVYIPQEDLERFGYSEADLAAQRIDARWKNLLEFEFTRTEDYFAHARRSVARLAVGRWAVMSGLEVYRAILGSIRRNQYNVFTRRANTSRVQKLRLAAVSLWWTLFSV
jgi:phytoene synthase